MSENQWLLFASGALAGAFVVGGAVLTSSIVFNTVQKQTREALDREDREYEFVGVPRRQSVDKSFLRRRLSLEDADACEPPWTSKTVPPGGAGGVRGRESGEGSVRGGSGSGSGGETSYNPKPTPSTISSNHHPGPHHPSNHHRWGNGETENGIHNSPPRVHRPRHMPATVPNTPTQLPLTAILDEDPPTPTLSTEWLQKFHAQDSNMPSRMHAHSPIISLDMAPVGASSMQRDMEDDEMISESEALQEDINRRSTSLCIKRPLTPLSPLDNSLENAKNDPREKGNGSDTHSSSASLMNELDENEIEQLDEDTTPLNLEAAAGTDQVAGPSDRANRWGVEMLRMHTVEEMINCEVEASKKEAPPKYARLEHRGEFELNQEGLEVCELLEEALEMRRGYMFSPANTPEDAAGWPPLQRPLTPEDLFQWGGGGEEDLLATPHHFQMQDGVMMVYDGPEMKNEVFKIEKTANGFFRDMNWLLKVVATGPVKTLCHHRLLLLEQRFSLHIMLNADTEFLAQKTAPHRDFYNVRKVDTHIHHSACMNQKHLLRFIKSKLRKEPDEVVIYRDGKYLTLQEVFESLHLTGYDLNVDTMDMHADKNTFHRFDRFNLKYNPCGQSRLREIFIKQDNLIHGRFLAELTKEVFSDLEATKYTFTEYRISVYGRKLEEWDGLAAWICNNRLFSEQNIWLIQLPRLYSIYKAQGTMNNFQDMLDNIFIPLFEVTRDPSSHPQLHMFLKQVVGFDMVDDESRPERRPTKHMKPPSEWDSNHNPAYAYYAYYVWANLTVLNRFRESKGYNTLYFRPHAGEAGDIDHLATTFFLANEIAHGNNLRKSPGLQYLFYLAQIGLAMSPLSNNSLFLDYHRNPFPLFFARGLNVTLSTDDPLQIHLTKEPLVEEYSIAAQVWKLTACDLCEIARNSVLQSGFPHQVKQHWVSDTYWLKGPEGNDIRKTNVPSIRMQFRKDVLDNELKIIREGARKWQQKNEGV